MSSRSKPVPVPPRVRDALRGLDQPLSSFDSAIEGGRMAHANLILGPRGAGKARLCHALAQMLLCPVAPAACGACPACKQSRLFLHPDLHVVFPATKEEERNPESAASILREYAGDRYAPLGVTGSALIGIDAIRSLKEELSKALVEGPRRIAILFHADRMTEPAQQSALKLLEEPPRDTVLLLTAEDPARILPTILSRCQRCRVHPLPVGAAGEILVEELNTPKAEARLLASLAGGALGRAIEMRQEGILELRDRLVPAFDPPPRTAAEAERRVLSLKGILDFGSARRAVELLLLWHHDLLFVSQGLEDAVVHSDRLDLLIERAAGLTLREIRRRVNLLIELAEACEQRVNPDLALHAALSRLASGAEAGET